MCLLAVLSGCSKAKEVEIDGETYYQVDDTYVKKYAGTKTFAPGEHMINYAMDLHLSESGYTSENSFPEIPEGYELYDTLTLPRDYSDGKLIVYFINTKAVEVEGMYNPRTNEVEYVNPGKVVNSLVLEN